MSDTEHGGRTTSRWRRRALVTLVLLVAVGVVAWRTLGWADVVRARTADGCEVLVEVHAVFPEPITRFYYYVAVERGWEFRIRTAGASTLKSAARAGEWASRAYLGYVEHLDGEDRRPAASRFEGDRIEIVAAGGDRVATVEARRSPR